MQDNTSKSIDCDTTFSAHIWAHKCWGEHVHIGKFKLVSLHSKFRGLFNAKAVFVGGQR